ncbi:MAG: hypothetical protein H6611_03300 [Ignavibacteriales bacterium]|nr:hypothetical protein [Ignavibacteriales bacterium]
MLFGSAGAITWAIRGTSGWGGVDGTIIPGLTFGIIWFYLSHRKNIDARSIILWLGLGIALGGELGYGQYVGWIRNIFSYGNEKLFVDSIHGYVWFVICGIGWAAPGAIILGWVIDSNVSINNWIVRAILLILILIILFSPETIDWLSEIFVEKDFAFLFPNFDSGIYSNIDKNLERTLYTNTQNFAVLIWFIISLFMSLIHRERTTFQIGVILGLGFGLGFMQSALWTIGYGLNPNFIDWWKIWELNSGFNIGILYAIIFFIFHNKINQSRNNKKISEKTITVFQAISGFTLLYFVGFEYFQLINTIIAFLFLIVLLSLLLNEKDEIKIKEKRINIVFHFSIFYLLFILFHGVTERLGVVFELFYEDAVDQYSWPLERIVLFIPFLISILFYLYIKTKKIFSGYYFFEIDSETIIEWNRKLIILTSLITLIGIISIWPAKISIFYGFFQLISIICLIQIDKIDRLKTKTKL